MPTSNTDFELFEVRISPLVKCGDAYIIDTSFVKEGINISALGPCKRFVVYVCCDEQKVHAEEHAEHIRTICEEMINKKAETFAFNKEVKDKLPINRILH